MKKFICTTTINPLTGALKKYAEKEDWELIVAGDLKTPHAEYLNMDLIYLSPRIQEQKYPKLSRLIGWNSIERRNFAILEAYERGADLIALVDDDNIPYDNWGEDIYIGKEVPTYVFDTDLVFDPFCLTNYSSLWHRGYPIQLFKRSLHHYFKSDVNVIPSIQANFWNGEPDIDAVCRINNPNLNCKFDDYIFPFAVGLITPFNSQNTIISRRVIEGGYFLFPFIGRMSDIWIAYYMTAKGFRVVYDKATVFQKRNEHNLVEDLKQEMLGYEKSLDLVNALIKDPENIHNFLPIESSVAWDEYKNIIERLR